MQQWLTDTRKAIVIDHATTQWPQGLPMGNGDLGLMLHGGPEQVTLSFNKSDVWDYRVGPGQGLPEDKTTLDEMVALARRQDWESYNKLFATWLEHEDCSQPSLQTCGQFDMMLVPGERSVAFRQELDLTTARAHVCSTHTEYREARQVVDIETFVPARDSVIPVTLASDKALFGKLRLWRQHSIDYGLPRAWQAGDTAGLDMSFPDRVEYTLGVRVIGAQGRWQTVDSEAIFTIEPCGGPIVLLVAVVCSLEHANPHAAAVARLAALDADTPARLEAPHRRWWEEFWSRSSVSLPDEKLQHHWNLGQYILGCSSQPGRKCPGLQGVWNRYNRPVWHTDYHADGNVQITFWSAYSSNHLDLAEPFYRLFMVEMRDEARRAAREFFGRRGLYYPIAGGPAGHELAGPWAWPGAGAWIAQHFWWHYLYSKDVEFLRRTYPFLKELSLFYEDLLHRNEQGAFDLYPTFSPEMMDPRGWLMMAWGKNSTIDLAMIRILLTALIEGSRVLGLDEPDRARWTDLRDHLAPYPAKLGVLVDLDGDEWLALDPAICRIAPIYPAGEIGLGSPPKVLEMARKTYQKIRPIYSGGGHCGIWCASAAAHLGDSAEALRVLHGCIASRLENGFNTWMQIDSVFGLPSAVNEMLLQSLDGVIRLFPAVPADWTASFDTLRAVGAFLVSAKREQGKTTWVRIDAERSGRCVVADPFGVGRARLCAAGNKEKELVADGQKCFTFQTAAGTSYELVAG